MKKRQVPLKNYIILFAIVCITLILLFYFVSLYKSSEGYMKNNSLLSEFLSQINYSEIENYIIDNPNSIMYLSSVDNKDQSFERDFKKLITDHEIKSEVIYLEVDNEILYKLKNNYFNTDLKNKNVNISTIPNLIIFENGKIVDMLYKNTTQAKISDFERMFQAYGVIDND